MDHARALGDTAQTRGFAAEGKFHGDGLDLRIRGEDGFGGGQSVRGKAGNERLHARGDGGNVQPLADDAGGGHHHVLGGDAQRVRGEGAHLLRHFLAVGVAGVGVAAVAEDGGGVAVGDVGLRHQQRRALDEVLRVHRGGGGALLGDDQRQIALVAVFADAAVDAAGGKALRGADAAFDEFHGFQTSCNTSPALMSAPIFRLRSCTAAPDAPLPRLS